ncbi:MAG: UDP-glucose 4-epimerase GalE [Oscillospiraceae bacterium]|nr:UDP-glucose 4-epimerase GalE [Oscillospiraceae bacterium]
MILLTGGAGYIGSHTAVELLKLGREVVIADDYSNSSPSVIDRIEKIAGIRPHCVKCDCSNAAALDKVFADYPIDAVIHFAGFKAVGESVREPEKYYRNNLGCTVTVLETMKRHNVKRIIFSSSATVYGSEAVAPYAETMRTGPCTNPYGWTKLMSEQIISDSAKADSELSAILLRYFNPIGAHESGLIGENPNGVPNNLMPYITQVAVGKLSQLNVFGNDYPTHDGTGVRDYIHVTDLALGHAAALRWCEENRGVEVVNLGTGIGYSVLDVVNAFEKASGVAIPYKIAPRRDGDIAMCFADASKAERVLGWRALRDLETMCRDSWRWQSMNPDGYEK